MNTEVKMLLGIGIATAIILLGGIFLLGKGTPPSTTNEKVDQKLLIRDNSNRISTGSAKVTLVEFGDYQCPACARFAPVVKQILAEKKEKVNFVFRHFPLSQHQNAQIAAEAAEAAGEQGKYFQMHDKLYDNQDTWAESSNPSDIFVGYAKDLGLDSEKFKKAVSENKFADKINQDQEDGNTLGVNATPTFFVNGEKIESSTLKESIQQALK